MTDIEEKAAALVKKLREVHEDPRYLSVWMMAQVHGSMYAGPFYTDELGALEKALTSASKSACRPPS